MGSNMNDEIEFIKRKGGIDILCELSNGKKSFNELKNVGVSPSTLSERLKEALDLKLIEQVVEQRLTQKTLKPKIYYRLTEKGKEILKMIEPIRDDYLRLRDEIKRLKEEIRKKEKELDKLFENLTN